MMESPSLPHWTGRNAAVATLIVAYSVLVAVWPDRQWALVMVTPLVMLPVIWWALCRPQRWLALFFAAVILLPPLPLALGNSGPHPATACAALGLFAGFLRLREWRLTADFLPGIFILFFFTLAASAGLAAIYSGPVIALGVLARIALFGIALYTFFYVAYGPDSQDRGWMKNVRLLFFASLLAALFACLDFYFQFPAPAGYGPQFVWLDTGVYRRAQGFFYEASTLGNFCVFFLVMIVVCLFQPKAERPLPITLLLGGAVILSTALIFSYSRASVLNLFVSLCVLAYCKHVRVRKVALTSLVSLFGGAWIVYAAFPAFALNYWIRLSGSLQYFWSSPEGILSGRVDSWRTLGNFLIDHPWHAVLGVGYKTLPYSDFIGRTVIADNMYLSLLVETGVVGLSIFIALNYAIVRTAWRAARASSTEARFFGTWMLCFWTGQLFQMLSGDLMTYWRVLPLYFWALAMAVRAGRRHEPS